MAKELWLSDDAAVELIRFRIPSVKSTGHALKILRDAIASGEVQPGRAAPASDPVLLLADDGIVGMDMRPGAQNKGGVTADGKPWVKAPPASRTTNKADLEDWLDRNAHKYAQPVAASAVKLAIAPEQKIHAAIIAVYDAVEKASEKPPNIKELPGKVRALLETQGYQASDRQIQKLGEDSQHAVRRRKPGATVRHERHRP